MLMPVLSLLCHSLQRETWLVCVPDVITAMAKDVYHGIGVDNPREGILIYSAVVLIVGM